MKNSNIEWTTHTFNPWIGCTKVSDGCKNCYAEALDRRWGHKRWGPKAARVRTSAANWKKPLQWDMEAQRAGERHRVFCASLADVFDNHESIQPEWRDELWELIAATPNLDWLLLTKRPENIGEFSPWRFRINGWPHNIWLGTTVENQEHADIRIPLLLKVPAKVRFLSCEPLLGPVDLQLDSGRESGGPVGWIPDQQPDWVIVGGESGHRARPFDLAWARSLQKQCAEASVALFMKQLGAEPRESSDDWPSVRDLGNGVFRPNLKDRKGGDWAEWPEDLRVRQFPEVR